MQKNPNFFKEACISIICIFGYVARGADFQTKILCVIGDICFRYFKYKWLPESPLSFIYKSHFKFGQLQQGGACFLFVTTLFSSLIMISPLAIELVYHFDNIFVGLCQQLNQMIEKKQSNWISMQSSVGFHCQLFDSNSRFLSRIKEEEISDGFKFYTGECEEVYQPTHPFSIDNTINFSDINQRLIQKQQLPIPVPTFLPTFDIDEIDWAPNDHLYKRGLKHLASLLLKSFFKKRFSVLGEVVEEIESQLLCPNSPSSSFGNSKEQKNIKRRIYDALNVMLSAGILEKQMFSLQNHSHSHSPASKSYGIVSKQSQFYERVSQMKERIQSKRQLLRSLMSKRKVLSEWMQRKRMAKQRQAEDESDILNFPLIILKYPQQEKAWIQVQGDSLIIGYKRGQVYSETDALEEVLGRFQEFQQNDVKKQQKFLDEITYI